jgi:hypothetical protein
MRRENQNVRNRLLLLVLGVAMLACALAGVAGAGTMPTTYAPGTYYRCEITHDPITMSLWQIGDVTFPDARTLCAVDTIYGGQLADGWCDDHRLLDNVWLWEIYNQEIAYVRHDTIGPASVSDGTNPLFGLAFPAGTRYYTALRPGARVAFTTFDGELVGAQFESTQPENIVDTSQAVVEGSC